MTEHLINKYVSGCVVKETLIRVFDGLSYISVNLYSAGFPWT